MSKLCRLASDTTNTRVVILQKSLVLFISIISFRKNGKKHIYILHQFIQFFSYSLYQCETTQR